MLHDWTDDVRTALRACLASPAVTLAAAVTFALGIGANTAIVSVVYALLLRPLPYPSPASLMFIDGVLARPEGEAEFQLQYRDFLHLRDSGGALAGAVPWTNGWGLALEGTDGAARLEVNLVGAGYFELLGAAPMLGRVFAAEEHAPGRGDMVVVLAAGTWRRQFGADPGVVGRVIRLHARPFTVVGVMPDGFHDVAAAHGDAVDAWVPLERAETLIGLADLPRNPARNFWGVARLPAGVTAAAASAELDALSTRLEALYPDHQRFRLRVSPLAGRFFADVRRPLWTLLGASLFVLAVACANVAHLLLVRAAARRRELATRLALGASRARLLRQQLVESLMLAGGGAALGVGVAAAVTPAIVASSPVALPEFVDVGLHAPVLGVAAALAMLCGVVTSLVPLRVLRSADGLTALGSGGERVAGAPSAARWLAGAELATAFVVVAGALLMLQSLGALLGTDLAFRHEGLVAARLELPQDRYPTAAARAAFGERVLERLQALPGAADAVLWGPSMFGRSTWVSFLTAEDQIARGDEARLMVWRHSTNPGALRRLGIAVMAGREFTSADTLAAPPVAVLSHSAAARLFPGADPIGRRVQTGSGPAATMVTVVGVAADVRHRGRFRFDGGSALRQPQLDVYFPFAQRPNALVTLGVRLPAGDSGAGIRRALAEVDAGLAVYDEASVHARMEDETGPVRFAAWLLNALGTLAVLLAAVGVYGVMAASVAMSQRELAVRAALGAAPAALRRRVVGAGLRVAALAVAVGGGASWALAAMLDSVFFGHHAGDLTPLAGAAVVLVTAAWIACDIPARRAGRIDPARLLRGE